MERILSKRERFGERVAASCGSYDRPYIHEREGTERILCLNGLIMEAQLFQNNWSGTKCLSGIESTTISATPRADSKLWNRIRRCFLLSQRACFLNSQEVHSAYVVDQIWCGEDRRFLYVPSRNSRAMMGTLMSADRASRLTPAVLIQVTTRTQVSDTMTIARLNTSTLSTFRVYVRRG